MTATKQTTQRLSWWSAVVATVTATAIALTGLPAAAQPNPSPSPSPSIGQQEQGEDTGGLSGVVGDKPSSANSQGEGEPAELVDGLGAGELVVDGAIDVVRDEGAAVPSQQSPGLSDLSDPAAEALYETADVLVPSALTEIVTVEPAVGLDSKVDARSQTDLVATDSIVVGAAVAPLRDLTAAVLGDGGDIALASGRPDEVADLLPRAFVGDEIVVSITPQIGAGSIPGAAFAADVSLEGTFGAAWVDTAFDASGVDSAYGGDYGDRLTLMVLPECALTTPEQPGCLVGAPLETAHEGDGVLRAYIPVGALDMLDAVGRKGATHLVDLGTGELMSGLSYAAPTGRTIIAAVAGADSQAGSFKATDLAPRGTWGVTEPAGGFTYSIPIAAPPVSAGTGPSVSLGYSSQVTDGKTSASNSQAGVIGEGWSMPVSFIERLYKPCTDDGGTSPQMCWDSPYAGVPSEAAYVLSLQGSAQELVFTSATATSASYRSVSDPTLKVTRYFGTPRGPGNGDNDGEYFKVETNDGSVFLFGFNPAGATNEVGQAISSRSSVAYQPVPSNNAGEPGYVNGTVDVANQAYRFYLDVSADSLGNAATFTYKAYTNSYTVGGVTKSYVRDTQLARIEYGQTFDAATSTVSAAEAKVEFSMVKRCVEGAQFYDSLSTGINVDTLCAEPSQATATSYPDVPVDLMCTSGTCSALQTSPTYFSTVRLDRINTFARGAANAWVAVESTQLIPAYPTTEDGSARSLWLDGVYTTGWGDPAIAADDRTTYMTKFSGIRLKNRVDWDMTVGANEVRERPLDRLRISNVFTDLGGRIDVTYARAGTDDVSVASRTGELGTHVCPQGGKRGADYAAWLAANPLVTVNSSSNTQLCFAIKSGADTRLYHHYVVTRVDLVDPVGLQPTESHTYEYGGNPAYTRAEPLLYAVGVSGDTSTFSSYRGFLTVTSWVGNGSESAKTTNQYFRGAGSSLKSLHDGTTRADTDPRLQGVLESSKTIDATGAVVGTSQQTYSITSVGTAPTWERANVTLEHNPHIVQVISQASTTKDGAWWATTTSFTDYDNLQTPKPPVPLYVPFKVTTVAVDNAGSQAKTQCQALDYSSSSTKNLVLPVVARSFDGTCADGTMTSKVEVGYDGGAPGSTTQTLTKGLVTEERAYAEATKFTTTRAGYDSRGRVIQAWLPNEVASSGPDVTWVYGANGSATWSTSVAPAVTWVYDKDGALWTTQVTRALGATSKTWTEPGHGNTVKAQGATATDWTHYQYDALGLMTAGWAPAQWGQSGTPSLASTIPTVMYRYDIYANGPALRSSPAVITTAPFVGDTGEDEDPDAGFPSSPLTGTTRRTMTFLDGFGRTIEQHAVAPDGSGGRTVTATRYNALGQVDWTSAPFVSEIDEQPVPVVMMVNGKTALANPILAELPNATDYTYDSLGRTTASTSLNFDVPLKVGDTPVQTTYTYAGPVTTVTAPNGAKTTTTTDVLGRVESKVIGPDTAHSTELSQTTRYEYETITAAAAAASANPDAVKVGFQQVTVKDPEQNATVFVSNLAGQRTLMVDPNAGTTRYEYDPNGQTTKVTSAVGTAAEGTITMGYDALGRMVSRDTGGSSTATWDYVTPDDITQGTEPAQDLGLLKESKSTTTIPNFVVDGAAPITLNLETTTTIEYDTFHRPLSSTVTLPISPLLGDLSGKPYETKMVDASGAADTGYDDIGQATNVTLPAMGGLPEETVTTGYRLSGSAEKLTLTSGEGSAQLSTLLVAGVTYSGTGQLTSRSYGNGVTRAYGWDASTRALSGLSASFVTSESGSAQTVFVQKDTLTRDVMGRVTQSTNEVPVADGSAADGQVTAECFTYDGFNRLGAAWTVAGSGAAACGTDAPASVSATGGDASATAYAAQWSYSDSGRITKLVRGAGADALTSTYAYDEDGPHPAAVLSVADGSSTDSFTYDAAGRMVSRTVDGVTTALTWDVTSSLTESDGQGGHVVYAYDASGQRVAQATVARPGGGANGEDLPGTATAYVASGQVEDPNTATTSTGDVTATRYYTFGGSTVAVRTNDGKLALMLGDEQGSTSVVMPVTVQPGGALASATPADAAAVTRTAYTPYGELRGADNLAVDRGWLGQVEDRIDGATGTGLTYLNARYYDPATQRFISPDPLMNPGDPKTLDPYRYADNNPVVFTDSTGLMPCAGTGTGEARCLEQYYAGTRTKAPLKGKATWDYSGGKPGLASWDPGAFTSAPFTPAPPNTSPYIPDWVSGLPDVPELHSPWTGSVATWLQDQVATQGFSGWSGDADQDGGALVSLVRCIEARAMSPWACSKTFQQEGAPRFTELYPKSLNPELYAAPAPPPCEGDWWYCNGQDVLVALAIGAAVACPFTGGLTCVALIAGVTVAQSVDGVTYRDWSPGDVVCNAGTTAVTLGIGKAVAGPFTREAQRNAVEMVVDFGSITIQGGDPCLGFA